MTKNIIISTVVERQNLWWCINDVYPCVHSGIMVLYVKYSEMCNYTTLMTQFSISFASARTSINVRRHGWLRYFRYLHGWPRPFTTSEEHDLMDDHLSAQRSWLTRSHCPTGPDRKRTDEHLLTIFSLTDHHQRRINVHIRRCCCTRVTPWDCLVLQRFQKCFSQKKEAVTCNAP